MSVRRWMQKWTTALAVASAVVVSPHAFAQQDSPPAQDKPKEEPPAERPVPDYDGRPEPPPTAGQVALWVPRVVAFPFYLVSEYLLRQPLGWVVSTAEREHWPTLLLDAFTFGPERKIGLVPTALFDFGFRPSVGFYHWWDDFLARDNALRVHGSTWGADWLALTVRDTIRLAQDRALSLRAEGNRRPDWLFQGLGPRSSPDLASRYSADRLEASVVLDQSVWRASSISWDGGVRKVTFDGGGCCDEPSILQRVDAGQLELPPGFQDGYTALRHAVHVEIDTRRPKPAPGDKLRLAGFVEQAADPSRAAASHWIRWGASVGGYVDINGYHRMLGLTVTAQFADPLTDIEVPFTEQIRLGGDGPMQGFLEGRLVDRSALTARLEYLWPIWIWLDGVMMGELGNVFGPHLEDFDPELLRSSVALGMRAGGRHDHFFQVLTGIGTETFVDGGSIESFRFTIGANREF